MDFKDEYSKAMATALERVAERAVVDFAKARIEPPIEKVAVIASRDEGDVVIFVGWQPRRGN